MKIIQRGLKRRHYMGVDVFECIDASEHIGINYIYDSQFGHGILQAASVTVYLTSLW